MLILDFYVDEPSCLGVPPFLSPYVRYVAGAMVDAGIPQGKISYMTVDQWRSNGKELTEEPELVVAIAGSTVPGKYLGGRIGTPLEVLEFLEIQSKRQKASRTIIGGPIRHTGKWFEERVTELGAILIDGDPESYTYRIASNRAGVRAGFEAIAGESSVKHSQCRTPEELERWAVAGAFITTLHPGFPELMIELESYRGCTRTPHCSFCTEALYGLPVFRSPESIHEEVGELYKKGNRHFRLGRQADLLTYLPDRSKVIRGFPAPNPAKIALLYSGIRRVAPELKTLHLDNINPGGIAAHPERSREALSIIVEFNTPGDTAAMGLETVDDEIIRRNNLKANRDQALLAIEIVNEVGAIRRNGIPALLPGLNFIHGLPGESEQSFRLNYEFLKEVMGRGLLLRRTNIRQVSRYEGTDLATVMPDDGGGENRESDRKISTRSRLEERFIHYRELIRKEIDQPMLLQVFPKGTIIPRVFIEGSNQGYLYGRALGSYPVTVKIPLTDPLFKDGSTHRNIDVVVVDSEERSLVALSVPIRINQMNTSALRHIPGIGKKRASSLFIKLPLRNFEELKKQLDGSAFGDESIYTFD